MCLAVPFELIQITGNEAIALRDGVKRKIRVDLLKDPAPGDYVLVHAGFAIEKVRKEQAYEDMETAAELKAELEQIASGIRERHAAMDETAGKSLQR